MFTHFYSDPHFGHERVIELCDRPFQDRFHMADVMIDRYNEVVADDDFVLWTGDCFFCSTGEAMALLSELNGRKALVWGNHDRSHGVMASLGFEFVTDRLTLQMAGRTTLVCHFPYPNHCEYTDKRYRHERPPRIEGQALIHGHTHQKEKVIGTAVHVGVDAWDFRPATYREVEGLVGDIFNWT